MGDPEDQHHQFAVVDGVHHAEVTHKALAKVLGVPRRSVRLVTGATSRSKVVEVPETSAPAIAELMRDPGEKVGTRS